VTPVRIGVVGCGRVAQVMHLPYLSELPEFELVALADISPEVRGALQSRYSGVDTHTDAADLIARDDLDAVAVVTPDHAEVAEASARAGKHVFVEKPFCFTPEEGRRVLAAAEEAGVRTMVGYMRRYDPAVVALVGQLDELGPVRIVRARDSLGLSATPIDIYTVDLPPAGAPGRASDRAAFDAKLAEGLGSDDPRRVFLYWIVLMLGVHDLAVLHAILGHPAAVTSTEIYGPNHFVTSFAYESGATAFLEMGVWRAHTWTDTDFDVIADDAVASLAFGNPWVKYLPTTLRVRTAGEEGATVETRGPESFHHSFRQEWRAFAGAIAAGTDPPTSGSVGLADIELAAEIVNAIPEDRLDAVAGARGGG
jgi:predicted dehydrogenase